MSERIWIVGASEGIGAALAIRLAKDGKRCAVSARSGDRLDALVKTFAGTGHLAIVADVSDSASLAAAFAHIEAEWGGLDTMIYSAGAYEPMSAKQLNIESVETMLDTNLTGAFRAVAVVLPAMLARDQGRIVLLGSVAGYRGLGNAMGYGASKAGINHFAENLKLDLSDTAIRVQLVSPGFVRTRLTEKNTFHMPFLMEAEESADAIADGLSSGKFEVHFPKKLSLFLKLLSVLPAPLYFRMVRALIGTKK